MSELGAALQRASLGLTLGGIIYLVGDLGAGKTTLVRGFIKAFGHQGAVKSPTYTLVEPYQFDKVVVNHFDFYRLNDPRECEEMGIRDYLDENAFNFIEWPEKAQGFLPKADIIIEILNDGQGRQLHFTADQPKGADLIRALKEAYE